MKRMEEYDIWWDDFSINDNNFIIRVLWLFKQINDKENLR